MLVSSGALIETRFTCTGVRCKCLDVCTSDLITIDA